MNVVTGIVSFAAGAVFGVVLMACVIAGDEADKWSERYWDDD